GAVPPMAISSVLKTNTAKLGGGGWGNPPYRARAQRWRRLYRGRPDQPGHCRASQALSDLALENMGHGTHLLARREKPLITGDLVEFSTCGLCADGKNVVFVTKGGDRPKGRPYNPLIAEERGAKRRQAKQQASEVKS